MKSKLAFSTGGWCWLLSVCWLAGFALTGRSDTIVVTNPAAGGPGTFQQAILTANETAGLDTVVFQLSGTPPFTITPTNVLPPITDPVVIDGTTQPGFSGQPVIELNGALTTGNAGLWFVVGASTVRGLVLNRFPVAAIQLTSASNCIQGNFIGTDVTGTKARGGGTGSHGILIKSAGNTIGGTNSGEGNLISGTNDTGIYILNAGYNRVQGNLIGVNLAGTAALSNLNNGIVIYGGRGNLIGGPVSAARNLISGNGVSGIYLNGATATANVIQGNLVGTDRSGSNAVSNAAGDGITLNGAPGNVISSNLLSGNGLSGLNLVGAGAFGNQLLGNRIGTDAGGQTNLGNHYAGVTIAGAGGNQIGGTNAGDGNVISGNVQDGIVLALGALTNVIQGNLIGLSAAGTNALPNRYNGISLSGAVSNLIGGTAAGARNVISGNAINGIGIQQLTDSGNVVQGNYLGTDFTGTRAVSNTLSGVRLQGCSNLIGGAVSGAGNVISGNGQQGVFLLGTNGSVTGNLIQGNLIGLDATGTGSLGNVVSGIIISGAANNQVGGTTPAARNVISANGALLQTMGYVGVYLYGTGTAGNLIVGNYLGTDASGQLARGNGNEGIYALNVSSNQIGGSEAGAGNLVAGNNGRGIWLSGASGNVLQGNFIGTKADGASALGNAWHGIDIDAGSTNNTVGGTVPGAGNRIGFANSVYCGVRVRDGAYNNLVSGNAIFGNGALGIDLSTAGANAIYACESGMAANAANAGQNFPTLTNVISGASTRIRGTMNGKTTKSYTLQFFASPAGDASGYGEGQVYLGQTNLTLGATCATNFTVYLPVTVPAGWVVTATATDSAGNTSEFSASVATLGVPPIQVAWPGPGQMAVSWTNSGGSFALQQTDSLTPPVTWLAVANPPSLLNNFWVATLASTNGSIFYRLAVP